MKIINVLEITDQQPTLLKDLSIGQVFTCEGTWPHKVFMITWCAKQNTNLAFVCLSGPESRDRGQTWGYVKNEKYVDKVCVCYDDPSLSLGEPA